jgi:hypothetical protein
MSYSPEFFSLFFFPHPSKAVVPRVGLSLSAYIFKLSPSYRPLPRTFSFSMSLELRAALLAFPARLDAMHITLRAPLFPPCKCAPYLIYFFHADVLSLVLQARI